MKTTMKMNKSVLIAMTAIALLAATVHAQNSDATANAAGAMAGNAMMYGLGMMNGGPMGRNTMGGRNSWGMGCNGMMGGAMMSRMSPGQQQEFLDQTKDLRKEMMEKRFTYMEALRNPDTTPADLAEMEKEMLALRTKMMDKMDALQGK
jgi:hypothetical protein